MKNFIIIFIISFIAECYSQDSLFVWPSGKEIEITVNANVVKNYSRFLYSFLVRSDLNSIQNVDDFYVEFNSDIDTIGNPDFWYPRVSFVWPNILMWSARDTIYDILPGGSLAGFSYKSDGLPTILNYYGVGYYELPYVDEGEAPDESEIEGGGILENSVKGYTLGPKDIDTPFIPTNFLDTLRNYTQRSLELGWIINQATADKYDSLFNTAKTLLEGNHIPYVESTLQTVLEEVDEDSSGNITSEAYALLRYNTEYLLENLPEVIPPVLTSISPSLALPVTYYSDNTDFTVTATGSNFTDSSVIYFDGSLKTTTYVSDSVLTFQLNNYNDISSSDDYPVWVSNYGSNSDTLYFIVADSLPETIIPVVNCVRNNGDRTFTAFFGYNNSNDETVFISIGADNFFSPIQLFADRGQPHIFLPGVHSNVFSVDFNGDNLTWTLYVTSVTANKQSTPCP
jgi:hypothetical protein